MHSDKPIKLDGAPIKTKLEVISEKTLINNEIAEGIKSRLNTMIESINGSDKCCQGPQGNNQELDGKLNVSLSRIRNQEELLVDISELIGVLEELL